MYCTHCGNELPDSAILCWRCGRAVQPLRPGEAPRRPEQTPPFYEAPGSGGWYQPSPSATARTYAGPEVGPPARKNPQKLLIGIGIAIVAVAVIAILIGVFAMRSTTGTASQGDASQGYATHQELIETYCGCFSNADEEQMVTLYPQALRDYYGDSVSGFLRNFDDWYDNYAAQVEHWMISDITEYDPSDYSGVASELGVSIESAVDVEVTMQFEGEDDFWLFDFDLIEIDGEWFLMSVW